MHKLHWSWLLSTRHSFDKKQEEGSISLRNIRCDKNWEGKFCEKWHRLMEWHELCCHIRRLHPDDKQDNRSWPQRNLNLCPEFCLTFLKSAQRFEIENCTKVLCLWRSILKQAPWAVFVKVRHNRLAGNTQQALVVFLLFWCDVDPKVITVELD